MLKEKTAIITGGSSGLGFACAKVFLRENAKVVITGTNMEKLQHAFTQLGNDRERILPLRADVSREEDVIRTVKETIDWAGGIQILVNNAGNALIKKLADTTLDEWNSIFEVHSTGTFMMCREVIKSMISAGEQGSIINISSPSGKTGSPLATAYSAAKAAVMGLTRALAKEIAPQNINVNCVCPGAMDTEMFHKKSIGEIARMFGANPDSLLKGTLSVIPLGRLLDPAEVAEMVLFLASHKASGITGQSFNVDCGYDIH